MFNNKKTTSSSSVPLTSGRPRVLCLGQDKLDKTSIRLTPKPPPSSSNKDTTATTTTKKEKSVWGRHEHGSYKHYYGARRPVGDQQQDDGDGSSSLKRKEVDQEADVRLSLLKEEWFRGLDHLDIGTNTGKVVWEIYQRFQPRSVVGIDIDLDLIAAAQDKLKHACIREAIAHDKKVTFRCEDFVAPKEKAEEKEKYHIITCLSVVKHIHLQGGDEAIHRLFQRIHDLLHPGGVFILEPQSWKSYRKRKHASVESLHHFSTITLRPDAFPICLLETIGFASMEDLGIPPGAPQGFRRPMYVFRKKMMMEDEVEE